MVFRASPAGIYRPVHAAWKLFSEEGRIATVGRKRARRPASPPCVRSATKPSRSGRLNYRDISGFDGGRTRARTLDPLIKWHGLLFVRQILSWQRRDLAVSTCEWVTLRLAIVLMPFSSPYDFADRLFDDESRTIQPLTAADQLCTHGSELKLTNSGGFPSNTSSRLKPKVRHTFRETGKHRVPQKPSRPGEFHPEPLTEPYVNLSIHTARATHRRLPSSADTRGLLRFPVGPPISTRVTRPLSSIPIAGTSSLLRSSPPLSTALVLSASRFRRLCLFPWHQRTGSQVPCIRPDESHASFTPDTA